MGSEIDDITDRPARPSVGKAIFSGASGLFRCAVDFVYPPVCAGCGVMIGRHGALCPTCWQSVHFIERPFCDVLGIPFAFDHEAGEGGRLVSAKAIADPPRYDRLRAVAIHDGVARRLVHGLKYRDRTELAIMMAAWMQRSGAEHLVQCDGILPVPLHWTRFARRKFNQSAELTRHLAKLSGKPLLPSTLKRVKRTSRQVGLTAKGRQDNVRAAFAIVPGHESDVFGKRLVLVDDVHTTGATVSSAAAALKRAGAAEVTVLTFALAISGPI
ncbi:ComF family protein [Rhizobiales bacterium RZME27]|uniref:ComF family protein n=1 Tax=Endobacterium cereale TaxID=2663029 RepID=A0A6A8AD04_9HYPH|nr:ComF family protein [Endobacterium cereale]MEB2847762.1 ComF family protein [Endobacterium cereale]MQY47777.1 ComF family protein [Endobacterium cereale]